LGGRPRFATRGGDRGPAGTGAPRRGGGVESHSACGQLPSPQPTRPPENGSQLPRNRAPSSRPGAGQLQAATKVWRQAEAALQKAYDAIDAAAARLGINCFPPDTLVATETGLRRIGDVEAGERVWGFDFQAGEWRLCVVEARHDAFFTGPLVTLESDAGEVTATALHPFWVVAGPDLENRPAPRHIDADADRGGSLAGRWVNSDDLREGDVLFLRGAGLVTVRRVRQRPEWMTPVCNLTVQGLHTFAVGEMQALVHNISGSGANDVIEEVTGTRLPKNTMADAVARAVEAGDEARVKQLLKGYKIPDNAIDGLTARLFEAAGVTPRNTVSEFLSLRLTRADLTPSVPKLVGATYLVNGEKPILLDLTNPNWKDTLPAGTPKVGIYIVRTQQGQLLKVGDTDGLKRLAEYRKLVTNDNVPIVVEFYPLRTNTHLNRVAEDLRQALKADGWKLPLDRERINPNTNPHIKVTRKGP
jgi:hypothetical protein